MSIICGINCMAHDTSACILREGELVAFVEEERLNRDKHTSQYPFLAIQSCLKQAGISAKDVDTVAYGHNLPSKEYLRDRQGELTIEKTADIRWWLDLHEKALLARRYFGPNVEHVHIGHHKAHSASAFLCSPFDEAVILSIDGTGDDLSTLLAVGHGKEIQIIDCIHYPHSLGRLWATITEFLGFRGCSGEGKVMALASFGNEERFEPQFRRLISIEDTGEFSLNLDYFDFHQYAPQWITPGLVRLLGQPRRSGAPLIQRHKDIAASLQLLTEEIIFKLIDHAIRVADVSQVCLAGGVALNCVANGKVLSETAAQQLFVQPCAGDAGTALGAALWAYHLQPESERKWSMRHTYWGPGIDDEDAYRFLERTKCSFHYVDEPHILAARLLANGRIVGWVQGRSEVGPRALGNRSILSDPRSVDFKNYLNAMVKGRESFRPFAPVTLRDKGDIYFELQSGNWAYDYMISVCNVKPSYQNQIPGVVHIDGTTRVQLTDYVINPMLAQLLEEFGRLTDIYVLLNTSFNLAGEPIVQTVKDAYSCFSCSGMDDLIFGHYWVSKHSTTQEEL